MQNYSGSAARILAGVLLAIALSSLAPSWDTLAQAAHVSRETL